MMYPLQIKVGTNWTFPAAPGLTVTSADPQVVEVTLSGGRFGITAKKPGNVALTLKAGSDLDMKLSVSVTP